MGMHFFALLFLFPCLGPGSSDISPEREFVVEAQQRIRKGRQSRARKMAVDEALKKGVFEAAGQIMRGKPWDKSAKRAVEKEFGRFVSAYRVLEEESVSDDGQQVYRVKLLVEVDVTSLRRELRRQTSEKRSGRLLRVAFSVSLAPGEGISSVSPAQVALEAKLKTLGFDVLPPLSQKAQPRFMVTGTCRRFFSGGLPEGRGFGATVGCRVEVFGTDKPEKALHRLSARADGFAADHEGAVRTALILAGSRLSERIAAAAVKETAPCFQSWQVNVAGPVGFEKMTGFSKSLEDNLPAEGQVRLIAFRRGAMTLEINFPSCRTDLFDILKRLRFDGMEVKLKAGGPRRLEVELNEDEDGIGR